jgi:hypothetical protein
MDKYILYRFMKYRMKWLWESSIYKFIRRSLHLITPGDVIWDYSRNVIAIVLDVGESRPSLHITYKIESGYWKSTYTFRYVKIGIVDNKALVVIRADVKY